MYMRWQLRNNTWRRLRLRIVQECGGDPEWENESVFQYQAGLDVEMPGEIDRPVVRIERPG